MSTQHQKSKLPQSPKVMEVAIDKDFADEVEVVDYELTVMTLDSSNPHIQITATEFLEIKLAMKFLDQVLVIEESFHALMENYRAYELGQMQATLDHVLDTEHDLDDMDDARRKSALDLDNLLSSARAFLDITPGRMKQVGGPDMRNAFKVLTNAEYDANPSYQFMEDLRNYSQHQGASITSMTFHIERSDKKCLGLQPDFKLVFSVGSGVHADAILPHFKAKRREVIAKFQDSNGKVTLTPIVRSYIVSLNTIIVETRALLHEMEESWHGTNERMLAKIREAGGVAVANAAVKLVNGRNIDTEYLSPYARRRIARLRNRNGKVGNLNRVQIAG